VWGTPLGSSLKAMLQDASLILIMKNENPYKEQSGVFEPLATALTYIPNFNALGPSVWVWHRKMS
jgi:hypothetical protein